MYGFRINHNISAVNTYRQLRIAAASLERSLERLSSGLRINRAADDVAGLSISERMRNQVRGLQQASRNASQAINLVQTAEGALNEIHSILARMRELAVEAASDNVSDSDRSSLDNEFQQLKSELTRIAESTEYNNVKLLDGSFSRNKVNWALTGDLSSVGIQEIVAPDVIDQVTPYKSLISASVIKDAGGSDITASTVLTDSTAGLSYTAGDKIHIIGTDHYGNQVSYTFTVTDGATVSDLLEAIEDAFNNTITATVQGGRIVITDTISGFGESKLSLTLVEETSTGTDLGELVGTVGYTVIQESSTGTVRSIEGVTGFVLKFSDTAGDGSIQLQVVGFQAKLDNGDTVVIYYDSVSASWGVYDSMSDISSGSSSSAYSLANNPASSGYIDSQEVLFTSAPDSGETLQLSFDQLGLIVTLNDAYDDGGLNDIAVYINSNGDKTFQVGADNATNNTIGFSLGAATASALNLTDVELTTLTDARNAITAVDNAIETINTMRAELGAIQNRLEFTISNLDNIAQNIQASESTIRDTDFAEEITNFTRSQILVQAATAMLAQANALPQNVLALLGR